MSALAQSRPGSHYHGAPLSRPVTPAVSASQANLAGQSQLTRTVPASPSSNGNTELSHTLNSRKGVRP